jgi:type III restriction enzyme
LSSFRPSDDGFTLNLPIALSSAEAEVISVLQNYQLERHIKKDEEPKRLRINKQVFLDPEFEALWSKIKHRTTYQVEYSTDKLIQNCADSIKAMEVIQPVTVNYREAQLGVEAKGVTSQEIRANIHKVSFTGGLPDIIAYVQKQTELTRKTIVEIIKGSGRLSDFLVNPQKFMDEVSTIINHELHRLMIDGIKYEKLTVGHTEWSMQLFREDELKDYFEQCLEVQKSVFDKVIYDSDIERKFAEELEKRTDIKLFVKLPSWFRVETPIGEYNPDWAIVKHEDATIYLVRETKGTRNFEKLRNSEADKIRCGRKHFQAIGVKFDVVVTADQI